MARSHPTAARSLALGALAVLVLALLLSLLLFVGQGGCTPAVAFDRPIEEGAPPATPELVGAPDAALPATDACAPEPAPPVTVRAGWLPVDGYVFDERTRDPVPFVEVRVVHALGAELVAVGADARFVLPGGAPPGELTAIVVDEDVEVGRATTQRGGGGGTSRWPVAVPIGPTIPIAEIDRRPPHAESSRARLRENALPEGVIGQIEVEADGLTVRKP
jgi:hypothetical protein